MNNNCFVCLRKTETFGRKLAHSNLHSIDVQLQHDTKYFLLYFHHFIFVLRKDQRRSYIRKTYRRYNGYHLMSICETNSNARDCISTMTCLLYFR